MPETCNNNNLGILPHQIFSIVKNIFFNKVFKICIQLEKLFPVDNCNCLPLYLQWLNSGFTPVDGFDEDSPSKTSNVSRIRIN